MAPVAAGPSAVVNGGPVAAPAASAPFVGGGPAVMHASIDRGPGLPPVPITVYVNQEPTQQGVPLSPLPKRQAPEPGGPVIVTAECLSPGFSSRRASEQQVLLEEMLNEKLTPELVTREARPIAFTVPPGCDSVDIFYGPIEINPGVGELDDLDEIMAVGDYKVTASQGADDACDALDVGSTIYVTLPWRAAPWVDLPANRLRVPVIAAFTRRND